MKNQNKGITLVALVITIVILLILAGISISALTGSGLFGRAKESKEKYSKAEAMEKVRIEVLASHDEKGDLDLEKLKKNIKENLERATIEGDNFPVTVIVDGEEFIVKEDGEVSQNEKGSVDIEEPKELITNINVEPKEISIRVKETRTITITIEPENATNKEIELISENGDIVTVGEKTINENGTISAEITAIKEGRTTIRALAKDGSDINDSCDITVIGDFLFDKELLQTGTTTGNVAITENNYNGTAGISITGATSNSPVAASQCFGLLMKWEKSIDLTNYNTIKFYAKKGAGHGCMRSMD